MKHRVVVSIVLCLGLLAVGIGVLRFLYSKRPQPPSTKGEAESLSVSTEVLVRGSHRETAQGYGVVRALRETLVSAEVTAVVVWVSDEAEAGQRVKQGQELVRLDRRDFELRLVSARAQHAEAEAALKALEAERENISARIVLSRRELELAERELDRRRQLEGINLSPSELDEQIQQTSAKERLLLEMTLRGEVLEHEIVRARAVVDARLADVSQRQRDLDRTAARAPFGGTIVARHVAVGTRVDPGTPLFDLVDGDRVEVAVSLGARYYDEVRIGATATLRRHDGGAVLWTGAVQRLGPKVDADDRTFTAYLELDGGEVPLPPGSFVIAEIDSLEHDDVIVVPRVAFANDRVFVLAPAPATHAGAGGQVRIAEARRPVVRRWLPGFALVDSGLRAGERVIVTSVEEIDHGTRVVLAVPAVQGDETDALREREGAEALRSADP